MPRRAGNKFSLRYVLIGTFLLIATLAIANYRDKRVNVSKHLDILVNILKELDAYYVYDIDHEKLLQTGIYTMLQSLDPYTNFIPAKASASFQAWTTGAYGGIGALIGIRKHKNLVMMLYPEAPAHQGGLKVGDEILQVNREDVRNKPIDQVSSLLQGKPDTEVWVTIARHGLGKTLEIKLTRAKVRLKNVPYFAQIKPGIGYIKLATFNPQAAEEVKLALQTLKKSDTKKLIVDLRGNPGGILEEAVKTANLFLDKGRQIVETKSKIKALAQTYSTTEPAYETDMPLILLINEESASAAEIIAGAIQDYDRGVLVGRKTYGKGSVQVIRQLPNHAQLKVTTAQYYIPSGRSIHKANHEQQDTRQGDQNQDKNQQAFKTQRGRIVYEKNGIDPDVVIERPNIIAPITTSLWMQGLIFDYTTIFCAKYDTIAPAKDFQLSEAQYQNFVTWLADQEYAYSIEADFDRLIQQTRYEDYPKDIQIQIAALKKKLQDQKQADLKTYSTEIKLMLQESITGRYYFQAGAIQTMLAHDQTVQRACILLDDQHQYQALLMDKHVG